MTRRLRISASYAIRASILLAPCFLAMIGIMTTATPVQAIGLKVSPLKYEQRIELGSEKTGHVDVSNPNDFTVTVNTDVQAFRQVNIDGNLEFYEDPQIEQGIVLDVNEFELAPREAARIYFAVDSNKLPEGGVYAALLFSTGVERPDDQQRVSSIKTSSRVGTLLILQTGDNGVKQGHINDTDIPFWQFGDGIRGNIRFTAADKDTSIAFKPELSTSFPFVGGKSMETGLVFPGNTRRFELDRTGSYFGAFPIEVTEGVTGSTERVWVFAVTGIWPIIAPVILAVLVVNSILLQRLLLRRFFKTPRFRKPRAVKKLKKHKKPRA